MLSTSLLLYIQLLRVNFGSRFLFQFAIFGVSCFASCGRDVNTKFLLTFFFLKHLKNFFNCDQIDQLFTLSCSTELLSDTFSFVSMTLKFQIFRSKKCNKLTFFPNTIMYERNLRFFFSLFPPVDRAELYIWITKTTKPTGDLNTFSYNHHSARRDVSMCSSGFVSRCVLVIN